jgi:osmotically-inducible protein OsmY
MDQRSLERREKLPLDDEDLQELIEERLEADPVFHLGRDRRVRVEVEVNDGEVTLHGVVRTALDRRKADIVARALGATTVDNRLRVEPEEPSGLPPRGRLPVTPA